MDQKTQRYMQRIEQIMQSTKKGTPHRPSKSPISCKANNLDKYLKYELSTKIIQKILDKNNQKLVQQFFNIIRITEYRQKEKIYRFIAVEKVEPAREMWVDGTIICKVLSTTLKGLIRKRYIDFIQCLQVNPQKYETTPQKMKLDRRLSVKDASPVSVRMRTLTNISKFQKSSSRNISQVCIIENDKKQGKVRDFAVKIIVNTVNTKINKLSCVGFYKILILDLHNQVKDNGITVKQSINQLQNRKKSAQQLNIFKKGKAIIAITNITNNILSEYFNKINKSSQFTSYRIKKAHNSLQRLSKIISRLKYKSYHHFLASLKSSKIVNKAQQSSEISQVQTKSKLALKDQVKIHLNEVSHEEPYNPIAKQNFYAFVDKIVKLIIVISKLLIPLKQSFTKIDHYASYAYRLQQTLKCAPRRLLSEAFSQIKRIQPSQKQHKQSIPDEAQCIKKLHDLLHPLIKIRLIEGFTHIKIISKERDLKIKIFPAKQNIIELTKKFIIDRGQYTTQSFQHWQELKSTLFSTADSKANKKKNKRSIR